MRVLVPRVGKRGRRRKTIVLGTVLVLLIVIIMTLITRAGIFTKRAGVENSRSVVMVVGEETIIKSNDLNLGSIINCTSNTLKSVKCDGNEIHILAAAVGKHTIVVEGKAGLWDKKVKLDVCIGKNRTDAITRCG